MRSKILLFTTFITLAGCGLFGNKNNPSSVLNYTTANAGCLDNLGDQVSRYASGNISTAEWGQSWDCVNSSLTLFTQFVRGSIPNGYTVQDIQDFMSHFLFTKGAVNINLVQSVFALKASLIGGTAEALTFGEINQFLLLGTVLKAETTRVLPYLTARNQNPTIANLTQLSQTIKIAGTNLAAAIGNQNNPVFGVDQLQILVNELQTLVTPSNGSDTSSVGQLVVSLKQIFAQGGSAGIEGAAWSKLVQSLTSYLGPVLAAVSYNAQFAPGINSQGQLWISNLTDVISALNATIQSNGGSISFAAIGNVIQNLPSGLLNPIQKVAISGAQEMVFNRILESQTPNALDQSATTYLSNQAQFWNRVQTDLETAYSENGIDTDAGGTAAQLATAFTQMLNGTNSTQEKSDIQWILNLIKTNKPFFPGNNPEILFAPQTLYSLHDLGLKHLIRLILSAMMEGYSTQPGKTQASLADFGQFINDVNPVMGAFQLSDVTIPGAAQARFIQSDLFMPTSSGGTGVDVDVASEYVLYFLSLSHAANRVEEVVGAACPSYGTDAFGSAMMNADCFRKNYFANYKSFWDQMPGMTAYYQSLSGTAQANFEKAIEIGARRYGYTDQCVGMYDIQGFTGIMHYVETLMARFDINGDGYWDTGESLGAFPLFQNELITLGSSQGLSPTDVGEQQAAFTYILKNGSLPPTGILGDVDLLFWWFLIGPSNWDMHADRNSLYQAIGNISPPAAPPPTTQCN